MKKIFIILITIVLFVMLIDNIKAEENIIPKEALRLRIIPNSNSPYDQYVKMQVRDRLQKKVFNLLKDTKNIDEARTLIKTNLQSFNTIISDVMKEQQDNNKFIVSYGYNYFPAKEYKGIKYSEGYYESLVVKIGSAKGDNWWCVLFPPLCLIEAQSANKVEYKFFVQEIIDKYFK